ncbi:hypothetical protein [Terricaulis sp.]|uniref:hypothetical protein n=1 Tax=Terricaulis sp. TaxID=2768686 RepID=UPI002AC4A6FB|nr:hypothetical protein [Terricaulis sp.]MDZ4693426.1 hypothetical protein [Terricaulis sp.]
MSDGKRPIDKKRDAALSFTIGHGGEPGVEMIVVGDRMLTVTTKSVIQTQLADQIDPERTDITLPNAVQQKVLSYGSHDAIICRTLLTGKALFSEGWQGKGFDKDAALSLSLRAAEYLSAMSNAHAQLRGEWEQAAAELKRMNGQAPMLPSIKDLTTRCENFVDTSRKCLMLVVQLAALFYPKASNEKAWRQTVETALANRFASDALGREAFKEGADTIEAVNNYRNACHHPDETKRMIVTGFELRAGPRIFAPSVEFVHPKTPMKRDDLLAFMQEMIERAGLIFEGMSALLCDENIPNTGGLEVRIGRLPDDQAHHGVRYRYYPVKIPGKA